MPTHRMSGGPFASSAADCGDLPGPVRVGPDDPHRCHTALGRRIEPQQHDVGPAAPPGHHRRPFPGTSDQQRKVEVHRSAWRLLRNIRFPERPRDGMGTGTHHSSGDEEPGADHPTGRRVDPHLRRLKNVAPPYGGHGLPVGAEALRHPGVRRPEAQTARPSPSGNHVWAFRASPAAMRCSQTVSSRLAPPLHGVSVSSGRHRDAGTIPGSRISRPSSREAISASVRHGRGRTSAGGPSRPPRSPDCCRSGSG